MFRRWLYNIILDAFNHQVIRNSLEIHDARSPGSRDNNYVIGTLWKDGRDVWILTEVLAKWEKLPKPPEVSNGRADSTFA